MVWPQAGLYSNQLTGIVSSLGLIIMGKLYIKGGIKQGDFIIFKLQKNWAPCEAGRPRKVLNNVIFSHHQPPGPFYKQPLL